MSRTARTVIVYLIVALLVVMAVNVFMGDEGEPTDLTLNEFQDRLTAGDIAAVTMKQKSDQLSGDFVEALVVEEENGFRVAYPNEYEGDLTQQILDADVEDFTIDPENATLLDSLLGFLPFILILGIFIFFMTQLQGGGNRVMQFGKAKAKLVTKDQPNPFVSHDLPCLWLARRHKNRRPQGGRYLD